MESSGQMMREIMFLREKLLFGIRHLTEVFDDGGIFFAVRFLSPLSW